MPERHKGLLVNGEFDKFEKFYEVQERANEFKIDENDIIVDTTDFSKVDYREILKKIKSSMKNNSRVINEVIENLKESMEQLNKMQEMKLIYIKSEVENIINNNVKDEQKIQKVLDMLLDLTYWYGEDMEEIYYSLLRYYEKINLEVSKKYKKFYLEIINEEEDF